MARVLVTGADGFVGKALCARLRELGHSVTGVSRCGGSGRGQSTGDIRHLESWRSLLEGEDVVVHLAARAHVIRDSAKDPTEEFRKTNVFPTARLAEAAVTAGVQRLIFVSSIGVHGESTRDHAFNESDIPRPVAPYAASKLEAEHCLREIEGRSGLEVSVIRPPLVYGPGVKGNFLRLLRLVHARVPIPLGAVRNRRSFVGLQNLCALLAICSFHPNAGGRTFVVADGEDVSTPALLRIMADAMGRRLWLPSIPLGALRVVATALGRSADFERMTGSLQVDATRARSDLGWQPTSTLQGGIEEMVNWFLSREH